MGDRVKILELSTTDGNGCHAWLTARTKDLTPVEVRWDAYPPSDADIAECEAAVAKWFADNNYLVRTKTSVMGGGTPHEEIVKGFQRLLDAQNN